MSRKETPMSVTQTTGSLCTKVSGFFYAKYRAFAPLSCLASPRPDVIGGWDRWRWLWQMRRTGRLVDPSVEVRCSADVRCRLELGHGAAVDKGSILWMGEECGAEGRIRIGNNAYIGPYCFLGSCHDLEVGEDSLIGAHSYLITVNHRTSVKGLPVAKQGYSGAPIRLGKNVWLGAQVVVLPGVEIGDNAVVGAGAVLTKSVPAGETWVGVPARKIAR
jgi:acetyltransferase-like isoleucine patch superfamily enzyme